MDSDTGQLPIFRAEIMQINGPHYFFPSLQVVKLNIDTKGAFNNHVDIILSFFDNPPTPREHFLCTKRGQKWLFSDHLPTPFCPRGY